MKAQQHRTFLLLAAAVAAAALIGAAGPAAAGVDPAGTIATEPPNPILRNDIAHNRAQAQFSEQTARAPIVVQVDGGFDWVSAGVGAAGACGLVLVAAAAASALRRRERLVARV